MAEHLHMAQSEHDNLRGERPLLEQERIQPPSNYETKSLIGLVINQTNLRCPQIYPRSVRKLRCRRRTALTEPG